MNRITANHENYRFSGLEKVKPFENIKKLNNIFKSRTCLKQNPFDTIGSMIWIAHIGKLAFLVLVQFRFIDDIDKIRINNYELLLKLWLAWEVIETA